MSPSDQTLPLIESLSAHIQEFVKAHPDTDINDVLSALAYLLVVKCHQMDIPRMDVIRNVGNMYEVTDPRSMN